MHLMHLLTMTGNIIKPGQDRKNLVEVHRRALDDSLNLGRKKKNQAKEETVSTAEVK